jgi:hypothetical protein
MQRFEPSPREPGIEDGLAARVHDPLWLLARQWQFGEFRSENAASVAWVDAEAEIHLLDTWRPAGAPDDLPYAREGQPLEKLVEQEHVRRPDPRLRMDGGARLARMLEAAGLAEHLPAFVAAAPFAADGADAPAADSLDAGVRRRLPDGDALVELLAHLAGEDSRVAAATALGVPAQAREAVGTIALDWLAWWNARAPERSSEPGVDHPWAWDVNRMEYRFEVAASSLPGVRLTASGYTGGRLDWWAVDAAPSDAPDGEALAIEIRGVPSPAAFGGMPSPRFWEMEDARFDPGAIDAAPNDLGRLLLTTYAMVYGNDWYVLPVRLPAGSMSRVTRFLVTDVFGAQRLLTPAGAADDGWSLFALTDGLASPSPGAERPTSPWFLLAPALPDALESPPVERVLLLRDEMANLAWAVETHVADDAGVTVDRFGERAVTREPSEEEAAAGGPPRYRVETAVPRNWYPLAPEQLADGESVRLRLAPVVRGGDPSQPREQPRGRLLADAADGDVVWLYEEEVPRAGAAVTRAVQRARGQDGSVHTWTSRSKRTGGGEGSSGLRFDVLEP